MRYTANLNPLYWTLCRKWKLTSVKLMVVLEKYLAAVEKVLDE